jgi:acetyl esterase/lipase
METFTYKRVGGLEIKADVYRPEGFPGPRPVLVWIHGGALMFGSRKLSPTDPLKLAMLADGGVVVSIDYRLAPETKLPEIIADMEDAFLWVRGQGPALFAADPRRIVAAGGSAGGYLAQAAGFLVNPRPLAVVSFWGYGDLVGSWISQPSKAPRHQRILLPDEEADRGVSGPPVSDPAQRPVAGAGEAYYLECRRSGAWPKAISGWDPRTQADRFSPFMPLKNITADYPPTLLIHGLKDTDVPCGLSVMMAAELQRHGVEHRLMTDPDADHSSNWSPQAKAAIQRAAIEFIRAHLN